MEYEGCCCLVMGRDVVGLKINSGGKKGGNVVEGLGFVKTKEQWFTGALDTKRHTTALELG